MGQQKHRTEGKLSASAVAPEAVASAEAATAAKGAAAAKKNRSGRASSTSSSRTSSRRRIDMKTYRGRDAGGKGGETALQRREAQSGYFCSRPQISSIDCWSFYSCGSNRSCCTLAREGVPVPSASRAAGLCPSSSNSSGSGACLKRAVPFKCCSAAVC